MQSVEGQLGESRVRALSTPVQRTAKGPASSPKGFPSSNLGYSLLNSRGHKGRLRLRGAGDVTLSRFPSGPEKDSGFGQAAALRMLAANLPAAGGGARLAPPRQLSAAAGPAQAPPSACVTALRTDAARPPAPRRPPLRKPEPASCEGGESPA